MRRRVSYSFIVIKRDTEKVAKWIRPGSRRLLINPATPSSLITKIVSVRLYGKPVGCANLIVASCMKSTYKCLTGMADLAVTRDKRKEKGKEVDYHN